MALNVGQDFKKRWLTAPEAVRQSFFDDLNRISELFDPQSDIQLWLENDRRAMQVAQLKVEQAYADLKAQLIEEARVRKQLALERSLTEKRAQQAAYNFQLQQDEIQRFELQTSSLMVLTESINLEMTAYCDRYHKNPEIPAIDYAHGQFRIQDSEMLSELENVRLRLELEAEILIEQTLETFRIQLRTAAQEEINYVLKNSKFSAEK